MNIAARLSAKIAPLAPAAPRPHPQKPRAALRVGVTGHRQARLHDSELSRIEDDLKGVLALIRAEAEALHRRYAWAFADADPLFYFISPLADGADMLSARAAIDAGFRLLAPLPFPREAYREDFGSDGVSALQSLLSSADAIIELDAGRGSGEEESRAYLQAGLITVQQADILIAIWDGEDARGVGGTAMIKDAAVDAGKPVIWINAAHASAPGFLPESAGLSVEEGVKRALSRALAPPAAEDIEHSFAGNTKARTAYRDFLAERPATFNFGFFFQFFERAVAGQSPFKLRFREAPLSKRIAEEKASPLLEAATPSQRTRDVIENLITARFVWADVLATHYGALYRSSYFFNYTLSAMAVLLALASLVVTQVDKPVWIALEVAVILAVLVVTMRGRKGRWHEKWIDYRHLAEELRHFRRVFLSVGGGYDPGQDDREVSGGWVDWYLRATVREAGMTDVRFTPERIRAVSTAIVESELRPQIAYHLRKAHTLHTIEHRLHRLGETAFAATLLICVAYLIAKGVVAELNAESGGPAAAGHAIGGGADATHAVSADHGGGEPQTFGYWLDHQGKYWVTMLSGFLPALGAAIFGIRVQGEFGSTAERSHATAEDLTVLCEQFERLAASHAPRLAQLHECIDTAGRVILAENKDWRILYISKPLNLPG
jgi:hypothetical protein